MPRDCNGIASHILVTDKYATTPANICEEKGLAKAPLLLILLSFAVFELV